MLSVHAVIFSTQNVSECIFSFPWKKLVSQFSVLRRDVVNKF